MFCRLSLLCLLVLVGCQESVPDLKLPDTSPVFPIFHPEHDSEVKVEIPETLTKSLHTYLGDKNTVALTLPLTIVSKDVTVSLPAGASISYELTDIGGTIVFNNPRPILTVKTWGVTIHPFLDKLVLTSPNHAKAYVTEFGRQFTKDLELGNDSVSVIGSEEEPPGQQEVSPVCPIPRVVPRQSEVEPLPTVYFWSMSGCPPCIAADAAFRSNGPLPFKVVKNPGFLLPSMPSSRPVFGIEHHGKIRHVYGWPGYKPFLTLFEEFTGAKPKAKVAKSAHRSPWRPNGPITASMLTYSGKHWGVSGQSVEYHLVHGHRFSPQEIAPFSQDQLFRLHSFCHKDD